MKIEYTNKVIDENTVAGVNMKICGCLPGSPLPCCLYCGVGPCAGEFRFKRKEAGSNEWIGSGCPFAGCPNACANCDQCSHNNDSFVIDAEHDGKTPATAAYMTPGGATGNGFTPPCIAGPCSCCNNKDMFAMVVKGAGKPTKVRPRRGNHTASADASLCCSRYAPFGRSDRAGLRRAGERHGALSPPCPRVLRRSLPPPSQTWSGDDLLFGEVGRERALHAVVCARARAE